MARSQQAQSLALRAATELARLWIKQDTDRGARGPRHDLPPLQ
jgi:hypothetical protein